MIAHEVCLGPEVLCTMWNNEKFISVYTYKSPWRTNKVAMYSESMNVVYLQIYKKSVQLDCFNDKSTSSDLYGSQEVKISDKPIFSSFFTLKRVQYFTRVEAWAKKKILLKNIFHPLNDFSHTDSDQNKVYGRKFVHFAPIMTQYFLSIELEGLII